MPCPAEQSSGVQRASEVGPFAAQRDDRVQTVCEQMINYKSAKAKGCRPECRECQQRTNIQKETTKAKEADPIVKIGIGIGGGQSERSVCCWAIENG